MKKILFINSHLHTGGCERSLVDVLKNFDYANYDVTLVLTEGFGEFHKEIPQQVHIHNIALVDSYGSLFSVIKHSIENCKISALCIKLIILLTKICGDKVWNLTRLIFRHVGIKYDAVIAYRHDYCSILAAYVFKADIKISYWHHGVIQLNSEQHKQLSSIYERMDYIIPVSNGIKVLLEHEFPHFVEKMVVIPNMVDVEAINKKINKKTSSKKDIFTIISVARMSEEKNMILCAHVGKELKQLGLNYHWIMVGEDSTEGESIKRKIIEFGIQDYFTFTGRVENPYPFIQQSDLMFHPSKVESLGISVLEGMAMHKPIIAVNSTGVMEYLEDGLNSFVIPSEPTIAANKIIAVAQNEKLRNQIISQADKKISDYYPLQIIKKIEKLLN